MKKSVLFVILAAVFAIVSLLCLAAGSSGMGFSSVINALLDPAGDINSTIIWQIRLPRILLAMLVGAGLAVSGCVFQGILRNPLAEPYTLGISGGAALGATMGIILGLQKYFGYYGLSVCAFTGAMLAVSLVYVVASRKYFSVPALILGGVILSFVFSSMVLLLFSVSRAVEVQNTLMWLMGDLSGADGGMVTSVAVFVVAGLAAVFVMSRDIDLLSLGEEKASHLGLRTDSARKVLFMIASLITGACVSATGIIGFVGLLVPHFVRQVTGPSHMVLVPASAVCGAMLLAAADTLARIVIAPLELPVGIITGILGGIFLLVYLMSRKKWEIF